MGATLTIDGLTIDKGLYDFITDEAMPGTGVEAKDFWPAFSKIVHELGPGQDFRKSDSKFACP